MVNCITETEGIQWEKAASNPLVSHSNLAFVEERPDLHAIAENKQANSNNFKLKKFEFTYNWFPYHLLTEKRLISIHTFIVDESE